MLAGVLERCLLRFGHGVGMRLCHWRSLLCLLRPHPPHFFEHGLHGNLEETIPALPMIRNEPIVRLADQGHQLSDDGILLVADVAGDVVVPGFSVPACKNGNDVSASQAGLYGLEREIERNAASLHHFSSAKRAVPLACGLVLMQNVLVDAVGELARR